MGLTIFMIISINRASYYYYKDNQKAVGICHNSCMHASQDSVQLHMITKEIEVGRASINTA